VTTIFQGQFYHTVDGKFRLAIPAQYRSVLETNGAEITGWPNEKCLAIYPKEEWAKFLKWLRTNPAHIPRLQDFKRTILSRNFSIVLDRQGRFVIPPKLREYAEIESSVVIVGNETRLEVWSERNWGLYEKQQAELGIPKEWSDVIP